MGLLDELESIGDGVMILLFLFQGYLFQHFCGGFLELRLESNFKNDFKSSYNNHFKKILKSSLWNKAAVTVLYLLLRAVNWIWKPEDQTAKTIVHLIWMIIITTVLVMVLYRASFGIASFLIVTFVAISECSQIFAYTSMHVLMKLSELWVWFVEREYFLFEEFLVAVEMTGIAAIAFYSAIVISLMYVFLKKVNRNFREKDREVHQTELLFLITPGVTGLLICLLLRMVIFSTESATLKLFYDTYPLLVPVVPVIALLCMASVANRVKLFQDMIHLNRERNSRVILEKQIGSMQEHITEIERLYSGIRSIKHDMRNTLSIVMHLSGGNERVEKGELEAYLTELNRTLDRLELRYRTGNAVADTLMNMKYHEILHIMPECKLEADQLLFPAGLVIQSYDYGVILGNALDNAMEACKKLYDQGTRDELFIHLSSVRKGNQFFIEVANSFDGKIFREREKEFPETCKPDKKLHGMGLYHIKSTAEKYYGAVEWSAVGKIFTLTVMMQNERRLENEL